MNPKKVNIVQVKLIMISCIIIVITATSFLTCGPAPDHNKPVNLVKTTNGSTVTYLTVREDSLKQLLYNFMHKQSISPPKSNLDTTNAKKLILTLGHFGSEHEFYNNEALMHLNNDTFKMYKSDKGFLRTEFTRVKINGVWYIMTPSDILYNLLWWYIW